MDSASLIKTFPFINGSDPQSFARYTLQNRLPFIIDQVISDNLFDDAIARKLQTIKESIKTDAIPEFSFSYPKSKRSQDRLETFSGKRWSELPFYFAEVCFYAEILEVIQFSETLIDPFLRQKQQDLAGNKPKLANILHGSDEFLNKEIGDKKKIGELLKVALWGNKSDLSQLKIQRELSDRDYTLIDHSESIAKFLAKGINRLDLVLDNSGVELFTDLVLTVRLLHMEVVGKAVLHAKSRPTFVSDATIADVLGLIDYLEGSGEESLVSLAQDIRICINAKLLELRDHPFWNEPLHFYEMADDLEKDLRNSDLIIFKGDLNYRRVFGDREIPVQSDPEVMANYLPTSSIAIRILKSELMAGIERQKAEHLSATDKNWMSNGKYGIIQYLKR